MSVPVQDGVFDIATGFSRKETNWKNEEITWSQLIAKLETTHRTFETHAQYLKFDKDQQDRIKDIGGFVGGYINSGRRKIGNILHRQLITLDIDFAPPGFWEDFTLVFGNASVLYSTHKHTANSPRLRLILPMNRPVMADEYQAIARKIAGVLDIEYFDPTTFETNRLMYWPSSSVDGEYLYEVQAGPWVDADAVLGQYKDWTDSSQWPTSQRAKASINRGIAKQGDPLLKPGLIGAFCRTYDIHQVIETFLPEVYAPTGYDDRYSYIHGSTSAGLVIHEDKFAYSHHGTDPVSMKLCNAFDLVRLHKFGDLDEDAKPDTPGNKLPSYTAMCDFAREDNDTKLLLGQETIEGAKYTFEGFDEEELKEAQEADKDWTKDLDADKHGRFENSIKNVITILSQDPMLKGALAFDDFEKQDVALKNLPWRKLALGSYLTDADDSALREYLETVYGITSALKIKDGLAVHMQKNTFHPVRDYLNGLVWDGVKRLDRLLIDYMGAEDNELTRAFTRKTLVGAVARVFVPGIKFDTALIMVGGQGPGKSTLIDKLGGKWYSDSFGNMKTVGAYESLQGVWVMELGELAGMRKADVDEIKHFMAKRQDRYRVAYGKRTQKYPRQGIFIGTTNNDTFLQDMTGNRRFWPVTVDRDRAYKDVFTLSEKEVGQFWAEAKMQYESGEKIYLDADLEAQAVIRQEAHLEEYPHAAAIINYLETLYPENWDAMDFDLRQDFLREGLRAQPGSVKKDKFCVAEIWVEVLGQRLNDRTRFNTRELIGFLKSLKGWESTGKKVHRFCEPYGPQTAFFRKSKM